jgi:hypothetical protein
MGGGDGGKFDLEVSRRRLLAAAGLGAAAAGLATTRAAKGATRAPGPAAPPVAGLHLQFGADASAQMTISWHSLQPVGRPRVLLGRMDGRLQRTVEARTASYVDAKSRQTVSPRTQPTSTPPSMRAPRPP